MSNILPTLYSQNTDGSVQQWTISTTNNIINKAYGKVGGKIQATTDVIAEGKNLGKKNATTASEQAVLEAQAQWEKKLKKGYTKTQAATKAGEVDACITGGIEPMLAHKFNDHAAKIVFPAIMQPKLDGIRCIAIIRKGKCTLWSRTRKAINSMPHIVTEIERQFKGREDCILDGELYNHSYKDNFEEIVSLVRPDAPKAGHAVVQYHIYDTATPILTFQERSAFLARHIKPNNILVLVDTVPIVFMSTSKDDGVGEAFVKYRKQGYEGAMIRNAQSLYENKRSYNLQKIKEFDDAEFKVIGVESGRGKMAECAIFRCTTKDGAEFSCKMEGELAKLKPYLKAPKTVIGKLLTVRYQGLTNGNVPRFPIGVTLRNYE